MAFCVVYFIKSCEVAVVPQHWIRDDFCFWPPVKLLPKILPKISRGIKASKTWELFNAQVLGTYDTYLAAKRKLEKAETTSDLNTTDSEDSECEKRVKRKRCASYTDSDREIEIPPSSSAPPSENSKSVVAVRGNFPVIEKVYASKETKPVEDFTRCNQNGTNSSVNNVAKTEPPDCVEDTSLSQSSGNKQPNHSDFEESILREINILKVNQRAIMERIDAIFNIFNQMTSTNLMAGIPVLNEETESFKQMLKLLPLSDMESLNFIEQQLCEDVIYRQMVGYLSHIGGKTLEVGVKLLLRRLLSDELASNFSYLGFREKASFKALKLCQVIHETAQKSSQWTNVKETEISKIIMNWLRHAKARSLNRKMNFI